MRKTVAISEKTHELLRKVAYQNKSNISALITKAVEKVYAKHI